MCSRNAESYVYHWVLHFTATLNMGPEASPLLLKFFHMFGESGRLTHKPPPIHRFSLVNIGDVFNNLHMVGSGFGDSEPKLDFQLSLNGR